MKTLLCLICMLSVIPSGWAKKYLTIDEANRRIFPTADSFVKNTQVYSPEERVAIGKMSGVQTVPRGNHVWIARKAGKVLGLVVLDHVKGKHETIDYAVGIDLGGRIKQIEILEYRESHGYEIRRDKWRNQFIGKSKDDELRLHKDVDNIGGATISCRNVTSGVKRVLAAFEVKLRVLSRN